MSLPSLIKGLLARHVRVYGYNEAFNQDFPLGIDKTDAAASSIDVLHYNTHKGIVFEAGILKLAVAAGGHLRVMLTTPANWEAHCRVHFQSEAKGTARLFEAPTVTGSTGLTIHNRNRNSSNTSQMTVVEATTTTDDGTPMTPPNPIFSANGPMAAGGVENSFSEYLLKPATDYLFKLTNEDAGAKDLHIHLVWYEKKQQS